MNRTVKRKFIASILCFVIGGIALVYEIINFGKIREELSSYLNGFSFGVIAVGLYLMYLSIRALRNPQKGKELENLENDERLKMINSQAMAITFKSSLGIEALISITLAFFGKMEISEWIGFIISFQLFIYLIFYYDLQNKN